MQQPFAIRGLLALLALLVLTPADPVVARDAAARAVEPPLVQYGTASVYARMLEGRRTASGELHDGDDLTAAHRTLPLGSTVRVTNLANRRSVVVRINDRGPNVKSRIIDLSPYAAARLGFSSRGKGLARVRLEIIETPAAEAHPVDAPPSDEATTSAERTVRR